MELELSGSSKPTPKLFLYNPNYNSWQVQFRNQVDLPLDKIKIHFSKYGEVLQVIQPEYLEKCLIHFKTKEAARKCIFGLKNSPNVKLIAFKQEIRSHKNSADSCAKNLNDTANAGNDDTSVEKTTYRTSDVLKPVIDPEDKIAEESTDTPAIKDNPKSLNEVVHTSTPSKATVDDINLNKLNLTNFKTMKNQLLRSLNYVSNDKPVPSGNPICPNRTVNEKLDDFKNYCGKGIQSTLVDSMENKKSHELKYDYKNYIETQQKVKYRKNNPDNAPISSTHLMSSKLLINVESNGPKNDPGVEMTESLLHDCFAAKNTEQSAGTSSIFTPSDYRSSDISLTSTKSTCPPLSRNHTSRDIKDFPKDSEDHSKSTEGYFESSENIPEGLPDLIERPKLLQKSMEFTFLSPPPVWPQMPMIHPPMNPVMHSMYPRQLSFIHLKPLVVVIVANIHELCCTEFILDMLVDYHPICASTIDTAPPYNIRYCYIYFETHEQSMAVKLNLDNTELFGKNLIVLTPTNLTFETERKKETRKFREFF